jgi:hypothetical protein
MWLFASSAYRFPSATTDAAKRKYSEKRFEFHVLNGSDSYCSIRLSTPGSRKRYCTVHLADGAKKFVAAISGSTTEMLSDATEKRYRWKILDIRYRRRDGHRLHSRGDHDVFRGNCHRPSSCSRAAATPRRQHLVPEPSHAACVAAPRHPHAAYAAAPRSLAPCRRPRSCPAPPREDAIGERERIEEKDYGRERRDCGMKTRKKEEKV